MSPRPIQPFEADQEFALDNYEELVFAMRVKILPGLVELGPYGEDNEYRMFELPEYGEFTGTEAGGMVSVRPDGWDFDVYLKETDILPADEYDERRRRSW